MRRLSLTDEQKDVATTPSPLVFVESVPGSGKTAVAAERLGVLRHTHLAQDPRGVVAVSFARSAVAELRRRTRRRWGDRTISRPNGVMTMDALHRGIVEFLLRTGTIRWPGGIVTPKLIDSWARQRGASQISPAGPRNQRWELALRGTTVVIDYRPVESPCWGMLFAKKEDYVESLIEGVCTHDEVRQLVGVALGRPDLRGAIDDYLHRSLAHLIVDEAFDLNGLDTLVVRRAIESGVGVTLVGDPWQALYEWRGARPDMVHRLLADYCFQALPMRQSFRFKSGQTSQLADALRAGSGCDLETSNGSADVVLASEWDRLQLPGSDVIPLSFGQLDCQTDASIVLILDVVASGRLGQRALNITEALRCLRRDADGIDLELPVSMLRNPSVSLADVIDELRIATKVDGMRRPSLPNLRMPSRLDRLALLREWLLVDRRYVPGLTFHQAKGRQWNAVDVVLDAKSRQIVQRGLDNSVEDHRKLYVGLTRGSQSTRIRAG
jgi:DNA helicase II / ATP-dependent DNA helicase PcrA